MYRTSDASARPTIGRRRPELKKSSLATLRSRSRESCRDVGQPRGVGAEHRSSLGRGPTLADALHRHARRTLRPSYERAAALARALSFEQRSAWARGRTLRLETRLDPRWQAAKREMGRRQAERQRAWCRSQTPASFRFTR